MKLFFKTILIIFSIAILSGCLYPSDNLQKNRVPYESQLDLVQSAIDRYQENTGGLLPIKQRDFTTPIYRKYPVDFTKLIPNYLQEPPGNSFENGGIYQYVLVNVDTKPEVKLIDLVSVTTVQSVKMRLDAYKLEYGYPPFEGAINKQVFTINYDALGFKTPPYVVSPFTQNNLPIVVNSEGQLIIDYRQDLYQKIQQLGSIPYQMGEDIRNILVEDSVFVPVFSEPYTIDEKNEPIFLIK
ncbi:hypothetical protein CIB95_07320 [Lottiidibacillus patelloidae]|uniref:ABC transporter periplasmic binding protein yphF n=1 Tax=Lottiidibacillus patelloidae TaxID=2670334 RepID=A0A263BVR9_9BACI|nr:hypothetical protein [Lottiidibacillus patelloidae]OZM57266.1 hypothetical protein CIB95_07320 [Lottiidibacillus patelloidae]